MKTVLCILLFLMICCGIRGTTNADSFRCGNEVVLDGETKSMVTAKCGKPHWREPEKRIHRGALKTPTTGARNQPSTTDRGKTVISEKWFYDCGPDVFVTALTFEEGRMRKVEVIRQGSGNHKCQPLQHNETTKGGNSKKDQKK